MAAPTTSTSCSNFWNCRGSGHTKVGHGHPGCRKLDGVAMWLLNGVTSAFFASLERCSCIRVTTVEDADDVNELPLIYNDGNTTTTTRHNEGKVSSIRRRRVKGKKNEGEDYADEE